jgi:hypothetical protein
VKNVIIQKQRFGIKSDAVLPKAQAEALSQALLQSTPENQSRLLDTIHKGTGGGAPYMATLKQIAINAPSAAVAGVLMDKPSSLIAQENWINPDITISPSQASKTILAGSAARKGTKDAKGMTMPKENDMRLEFSSAVQNAFAGDAQGAAMAYEVAKDYYAGIMAQKGITPVFWMMMSGSRPLMCQLAVFMTITAWGMFCCRGVCRQSSLINRSIRRGKHRSLVRESKHRRGSMACKVTVTASIWLSSVQGICLNLMALR